MERKENDLMMNIVANPEFTIQDFATIGFNMDNTSLQDKQVYKNNPSIQKRFSDEEGKFNEKAFNDAYNNALIGYNLMAQDKFSESVKDQIVSYHRDNIFAPEEQKRTSPDFKQIKVSNPDRVTSSISRLGEIGARTKSRDELAQGNKVLLNPKEVEQGREAKWGETPNGGFFDYFFDTLVMAQWDEDGVHVDPITGEEVQHHKGELKISPDGTYYYEKLDGRDIYGRQVLNKMNVLTEDGSKWNKYDFFDSDDIDQKSVGGTTLKNLALVGTMFIPYVGPWITGLSLVPQIVGLTGTLGKMFTGSESPVFSALEGWGKSLNRQTAKSEYAQENTWCWENFITLIGDVAGQLKEQRFFFEKVPALFKGSYAGSNKAYNTKLLEFEKAQKAINETKLSALQESLNLKNPKDLAKYLKAKGELEAVSTLKAQADMDSWIKGYNKIGEVLSKGYMTAITVGDTYGEAKAAGASDLDATLLTLGYAAGEYAILNTGIGEWILPELRADRYKNKAIIKALTTLPGEKEAAFGQLADKASKKEYVKWLFNKGKDIAKAEYANGTKTLQATLAAGIGEGVEEVSEELLADFSKGCFNAVKWLQGSDTRLDSFGFSWKDGERKWDSSELFDRYSMSLVGGFVGGGLTNLGTNYRMGKNMSSMTSEQAMQEVVYMARNNELDGLYKTLDKTNFGNKNLSATEYEELADGKLVAKPGTPTNNQDVYVKNAVRSQIDMIKNILDAEGANITDESFLDQQTLKDLRFNALHKASTAGLFMQEFNTLSSQLVKLTQEIRNAEITAQDTNKDGTVTDTEVRTANTSDSEKLIKDKKKELNEVRKQLQELVEGKRADEFIGTTLFEMTSFLSGEALPVTLPLYAEHLYKRKYNELSDKEKENARKKYKEWKQSEGKDQIKDAAQIYKYFAEQSSNAIKNGESIYLNQSQQIRDVDNVVRSLYESLNYLDSENSEEWLNIAQVQSKAIKIASLLENTLAHDKYQLIVDDISAKEGALSTITDPTLKAAEAEKIQQDFKEQVGNLVVETIQSQLQPIINQGFANTETKNQLHRILGTALNIINPKQIYYDNLLDIGAVSDPNPYTEIQIQLQDLDTKIGELNNTPLEQNLNEFSISLGNDPINLTQLLTNLNTIFNRVDESIRDFSLEDSAMQDLSNAIATLEIYKMAINGAKVDNIGLENLYGYNATLNEVAKKVGKNLELAEIDSNYANLLLNDIDVNLNKLKFLHNLYTTNQGQKLTRQKRVAAKTSSLLYSGIKKIVAIPDNDEIRSYEGFSELEQALNAATLLAEITGQKNYSLTSEQNLELKRQQIAVEDSIYNFIQKNLDVNKIEKIIGIFDVYSNSNELLNENLEDLDGPSMIWYIAARGAIKSSDFYSVYKNLLDPNSKIAPIATQEMAVYNNYASIINGDVISLFHKAYRQHVKNSWADKSEDQRKSVLEKLGKDPRFADPKWDDKLFSFIPVPRYDHITLVEGIPGSGKTEAVIRTTLEMVKATSPDLLNKAAIVHGANAESATILKENVDIEGDTFGHDDFLRRIIQGYVPYTYDNNGSVDITNAAIDSEGEYRVNFQTTKTDPFSIIIIDEISKFNTFELDAINKYATEHGITVITAGDFDQIGVIGKFPIEEGVTYGVNLERNQFSRTPKLGVSMRTDNSIKTKNLSTFQTYMNSGNLGQDIILGYYEDETGLYGDKLVNSEVRSDWEEQIDKLIKTLQPEEKIGFIYEDVNSQVYKYITETTGIKEHFELFEGGAAQGLEGRYYIIDKSTTNLDLTSGDPSAIQKWAQEIYTGISRASQGCVLILPTESYSNIKNKGANKLVKEPLGQQAIAALTTEVKGILNQVATGKTPEYKPRTKLDGSSNNLPDTDSATSVDSTSSSDTPRSTPPVRTNPSANTSPTTTNATEYPINTISKDELRTKYGPIVDLDKFTVEYNGNSVEVEFVPITIYNNEGDHVNEITTPVFSYATEEKVHGTAAQIDWFYRPMCLIKIGDWVQPFYMSSGNGGKNIPTGVWYPFFGVHGAGWINKTKGSDMLKFYDNPIYQAISNKLNEVTGTNLNNKDAAPSAEIRIFAAEGEVRFNPWRNQINASFPEVYFRDEVDEVIRNIEMAKSRITEEWNKLVNRQNSDKTITVGDETLRVGDKRGDLEILDITENSVRIKQADGTPVDLDTNTFIQQWNNTPESTHPIIDSLKVGDKFSLTILGHDPFNNTVIAVDEDTITVTRIDGEHTYNKKDLIQKLNDGTYSINSVGEVPEEFEITTLDDDVITVDVSDVAEVATDALNEDFSDPAEVPAVGIRENNGTYELDLLMYSFNTFELGCLIDNKGQIIPDSLNPYRFDSINGLLRIDKLVPPSSPQNLKNYIDRLGRIRSMLLNAEDKTELCRQLSKELKIEGLEVSFALKAVPNKTEATRNNASRDYVAEKPGAMSKHKDEKVIFNRSTDTRSSEVVPHSLVAIIGSETTGDLLEMPLLTLANVMSICQYKDIDGQYKFPDLANIVESGKNTNLPYHKILSNLLAQCNNNPAYKNIANLIKLYQFTYEGLFKIEDNQWLPSKNLNNLGSVFTTHKGDLHLIEGYQYSESNRTPLSISEFAKDSQITVTPVMKSITGNFNVGGSVGGNINIGHPFVLISYDKNISSTQDIVDQYIKQHDPNYQGIEKVRLHYITAPKTTVSEYCEYLEKIFFTKEKPEIHFGNSLTPYYIFKQAINNPEFLDLLKKRLPQHKYLLDYIRDLNLLGNDTTTIYNRLCEKVPIGYSESGEPSERKVQLATYLARNLLAIAYNKTSLIETINKDRVYNLDQGAIQTIQNALGDFDIYYTVKLQPGNAAHIGPFILAQQGANWTLDGKPYTMNGKIDSYMFAGDMNSIIEEWVNRIQLVTLPNGMQVYQAMDKNGEREWYKYPSRAREVASKEYTQLQNIISNLQENNFNVDLSRIDSNKKSLTESELQTALDIIIKEINANYPVLAIKYNDNIVIADKILEDLGVEEIRLFNQEGYPISELQDGDNIVIQAFDSEGNRIEYQAFFTHGLLEVEIPIDSSESVTLSVTDVNLDAYLTDFRALISEIEKILEREGKNIRQLPILNKIKSQNITSAEDLIRRCELIKDRVISYLEQVIDFNPTLVQELIAFAQREQESTPGTCRMKPVKILFK